MPFDGDPKLYSTGEGLDLSISSGQPEMDEGLENSITLSLFGGPAWWGNAVSSDPEKIAGPMDEIMASPLTPKTISDTEEAVKVALDWMISEGVAQSVSPSVFIPSVGWLSILITIEQPNRTSAVRYNINWQTMAVRVGAL